MSAASPPVLTCDLDPSWASGDAVQITGILNSTPAYSSVNGLRYVAKLSATTYGLYASPGPTSPLPNPGTTTLNSAGEQVTGVSSGSISWNTSAANGIYSDAAVSELAHDRNLVWTALKYCCSVSGYRDPYEHEHACLQYDTALLPSIN